MLYYDATHITKYGQILRLPLVNYNQDLHLNWAIMKYI